MARNTMTRKAHAFVQKVVYPMTIVSMVLSLAAPALPTQAAITPLTVTALATSAQTIGPSSSATAVLGLNTVGSASETFAEIDVAVSPSAGLTIGDFATLGMDANSGFALYQDNGSNEGSFDTTDTVVTLPTNPTLFRDGSSNISKLTPSASVSNTSTASALSAGDLAFTDVTAGGNPTTAYSWHMVTTGGTGPGDTAVRLDGAGAAPTYRTNSNQFSKLSPASTGSYVINGTSNTTSPALTTGDIIFYQTGTGMGRWGLVTGSFTASAAPVDGANLANATYRISKLTGQTATFTVAGTNAITFTGFTPQVGDFVLYQTSTQPANQGIVTSATATSGTFAVDSMVLTAATYRISKMTDYGPATFSPSTIPTTVATGDLVWGLPTANPATSFFNWHIASAGTSGGATNLRLDAKSAAPSFGFSVRLDPPTALPANDTGANAGNDFYIAVRTSTGAVNNHAFKLALAPGLILFSANDPAGLPAEVVSQTYTIATTAQQSQTAGANTTAIDQTNGFLRLKQSSDFKAAVRVQFGSTDVGKTLSSIAMTFATADGTTPPTWTQSATSSSELLDLATTGGGVSLWKDAGAPGFQGTGTDTQVTLAASPVYGASNAFTITPATPSTLAADDVYFIVLKSDTSGVTNNNAFTVSLASSAITLSANSPTIAPVTTPPIRMDTTAPTISSVSPVNPATPSQLDVRFSEPVQKIGGGGAITFISATDPFTFTDAGGTAQTITAISHNAFSDFATLTMSANLDATDLDSTPATLAAAASKIEDGAGNAMGTTATNLGSPLNFTTVNIPQTFVGAIHTTTPLATLAAAGGTADGGGKYSFATNAPEDATKLSNLGLTLGANNGTDNGKLTGTIAANTAGSHNVTIRVTDSSAPTPQSLTRQFTITVASVQGGTVPGITNVNPPAGAVSTTATLTITGSNTSFAQGTSQVSLTLPPNQGTGTIASTTTAVTGTGTSFTTQLAVGDSITASGQTKAVAAITNNTSLTVDSAFSSNLSAGTPFTFTKTNGITVGSVTVASATSLTVPVTIAANAATGGRDVIVTTGTQVVTMLGGFSVTGAVTAGLNLVFPTDSATGIQLPTPGFQFSPSTSTTYTNYRISVSTTQDFASLVWDYAFPKPADAQNTNFSHCSTTSCNLTYGASGATQFLTLTQPTQLIQNTKYYWRVQTYKGTLTSTNVTNVLNKLEDTPVRNFTTVTSVTDTQPPQIEHRPLYEARANAALTLFARVNDNIARTTTNPVLSTTLFACQGANCTLPASTVLPAASTTDGVVAGDGAVGSNYFSYTLPVEIVGASAGTVLKYQLVASDGTNTTTFNQPSTTGTGTLASTGTAVTGTGTAFTTQLTVGDTISAGGQNRTVTAITNATSLTTDSAFNPTITAGASFTFSKPFLVTTTAAAAATIAGTVKDSTDTCSTAVQGARVFAEGTSFSATSGADCTFTLAGLTAGAPYNLVAVKDGFSDRHIDGVAAGSTGIPFKLGQGTTGGFGGDSTRPRVKFTAPNDGMQNMPGNFAGFMVMVSFDKPMSQTSVTTTGNMTVSELNVQTGSLTDITATKGAWTYNPTFTMPFGGFTESNVATWALSQTACTGAPCILGDSKTFAVTVTPNVTDTAGNAVQGNQSDGSFTFTFSTGGTANFTGFNSTTGAFAGGEKFGEGNFIPPHVVGTTPSPGGFAVPRNSKMLVNFDKAMADDATGYTLLSNIKLFEAACPSAATANDVSSSALNSATLSSDKQVAQVTLKSTYNTGLFAANTTYCLRVLGGAKGATGTTMGPPNQAAQVMWTTEFKTGSTSDTAAPTVTGSIPDNAATSVSVTTGAMSVSFNKDMDPSTLTTTTLTLTTGSTSVSGTAEYRPFEKTAYFLPKSSLTPLTTYTLTVTTGAKGLNGVALAAQATRTFTTGAADTTAPKIEFTRADDNSLAITFSRPMNASKATDTLNFGASVLKSGNYTVKFGTAGFDAGTGGTAITLPATASFTYDAVQNTVIIQGYRPATVTPESLRGQEIYVSLANVKGNSGVAISTANNENTGRAPCENSGTTQGALGPGAVTGDAFTKFGELRPDNFSSTTHGFAPPVEVRPFNKLPSQTTIYGVRIPISKQIPSGGTVVLTFPAGFDVTSAQQDINSPKRKDINGPGTGTPTFKCQTNVATGKSCGGGAANADDTGTAQGGLADDGVVVNITSRTVTIYVNGGTRSESGDTHDFLDLDIAGIKNSSIPKDFSTSGYTVDVKTKSGTTALESLTSNPFFIEAGASGSNTISGTITVTGNQTGDMKVYLDSPLTGPLEATATFASGTTATYTFSSIPNGDYMLRTDPYVIIGATELIGKFPPEYMRVSGNVTKNFTLTSASSTTGASTVTISIDGPSGEVLDIFAGSQGQPGQSPQFRILQKTLDANAGAENFTMNLTDGVWFLGVGPQMPKGASSGPPPAPNYLPPKPKNVRIANPACVIEGVSTCTATFTLTAATKTIRGLVQDGSGKIMTDVEVFAYSPNGGFGTHGKTDAKGAFSLGVTDGLYNVGAFIPGMPSSNEISVEVTSDATTYLKIAGAAAITPAAAATSFVIKLAKPDLSISGKITDGTNAVQGASVYAYKQGAPGNTSAISDSSGSYTLYVTAGTWRVGVHVPQYGSLSEQTVIITTANATNINFSPSGTGTFFAVSGRAYQDTNANNSYNSGEELVGAFIRIRGNGYFNETQTGSDGTYSFKVPAGNGYVVDGFMPNVGELASLTAFNVTTADVTDKDLKVATLRTITVTFSTSVTRAFVELRATTGNTVRKEIKNATSGTFSVPDGSYVVRVDLQGAPLSFASVAATDGNTVYSSTTGVMTVNGNEGLTVTIPTLRSIAFTVSDGTSTVADAWVELANPTSGEHFGNKTGTNGQVTLQAADGTYFVNAMKPGLLREPTSLTISSTTAAQTLTMAAATRTIAGTVLVGTTGVANAFVHAEKTGGGGFAGTKTGTDGTYTLSVSEGTWNLFAIAEGFAEVKLTEAVNVTSASATGKNITLSTTVTTSAPKSQPITPSTGGSLEDNTSGVKLNIPANALGTSSSAGNVEAKKTNNFVETATGRPVVAVEISATDSSGQPIKTLNDSVTVEITLTKAELAAAKSDSDSSINTKSEVEKLDLAFWDETLSNWTTLPTTHTYLDSAGAVLTAPAEDLSNVASVELSAVTDHFSLYAPLVSTDPSAPATPTGLSLGSVTTTTIPLGWTVVSGATGYNVYRSTSSTGTFSRLGSDPTVSSGSTNSYTDSGLSASQTFFYKISALNNNGESAASSAISGTTSATTTSSSSGGGSSTVSTSTSAGTSTEKKAEEKKEEKAAAAEEKTVFGFKDGKFQLMTKAEADALHEAAEKAKKEAAPKETKKEAAAPGAKAAAAPAKAAAKVLVTIKALPHLSAQAAKVVTSVLKRSAIIFLPEAKGAAYYVDPKTQEKSSLGRPAEAFNVMRSFGKGITNKDLEKIPESTKEGDTAFACKHAGTIFLQVQSKGEAWYVHPENCKRYFLNRPADAFELMRKLALGVSTTDASAIPESEKSKPVTPATPAQPKEEPKKSAVSATPASPALDKLSPLARPLTQGMKGDDVKTLQTILAQKGYFSGEITGTMDDATFAAVREMQVKEGLVKNDKAPGFGTVGPATRAFVNKLLKEDAKPAAKVETKAAETKPKQETTPAPKAAEQTPAPKAAEQTPAPKAAEQTPAPAGESALDKLKRLLKQ